MSPEEADSLSHLMGKLMEKNEKKGYELKIDQMNELHLVELLKDTL